MFTMTKAEALAIQGKQLDHYAAMYPHRSEWLREKIKAATTADLLEDDVEYDMVTINRHIPRGGWFEVTIPEIVENERLVKERHEKNLAAEMHARTLRKGIY